MNTFELDAETFELDIQTFELDAETFDPKLLSWMLKLFSWMPRLAQKPSLVLSDHFADVLLPFSLQQKEMIMCTTISF